MCILGDFDKGLQSQSVDQLLTNNNTRFSRCVRHMNGNCKSAHGLPKGKQELFQQITFKLAKARTRERYDIFLSELEEKIGIEHRNWWDERFYQFATFDFISNLKIGQDKWYDNREYPEILNSKDTYETMKIMKNYYERKNEISEIDDKLFSIIHPRIKKILEEIMV